MSVARALLQIIGTTLVAYSTQTGITESMWATISGGVLMIVPVVWGLWAHTQTNAIATVAAMPEVQKVVAVPEIANVVLKDDPKVVTR